jgi:hypothetical protein
VARLAQRESGKGSAERITQVREAVVSDDGVVHFQKVSVGCEYGAFQVV